MMDNWVELSKIFIRALFFAVIPAVIIYFRYKKKTSTGFSAGMIITSFLIGIIAYSSVQEDPVEKFIYLLNSNKAIEAKKEYKKIIQSGPKELAKIDERDIIYKDLYKKIRTELVLEYNGIAQRYFDTYQADTDVNCKDIAGLDKRLGSLKHAVKLIEFSESIGRNNNPLKSKLNKKIKSADKKFISLKEECK